MVDFLLPLTELFSLSATVLEL